MAPPKKKPKATSTVRSTSKRKTTTTTTNPTRSSKRTKQGDTAATIEGATSFLTLPGEIRNSIYVLVLPEPDTIQIRQHQWDTERTKVGGWQVLRQEAPKWREPEILMACKKIRKEALPMYYGNNSFKISMYMTDFASLANWLATLIPVCGSTPFRSLRLYMYGYIYENLQYALPFLRLIRETGSELCVERKVPIPGTRTLESDLPEVSIFESRSTGTHESAVLTSLAELFDIGRKAHAEGWDEAYLDWEFDTWMQDKQTTKNGRSSISQYRRKATARAKVKEADPSA